MDDKRLGDNSEDFSPLMHGQDRSCSREIEEDESSSTVVAFPQNNGNDDQAKFSSSGDSTELTLRSENVAQNSTLIIQPVFSMVRVWICITIATVSYITACTTLIPLATQYFSFRIGRDKFNVTINFTAESNCVNSTPEAKHFINSIQTEASNTLLYSTLVTGLPAICTSLFAGSYSDYLGRKPLLVITTLGGMFRIVILLFIVKLDWSIKLYYLASFVDGISGSMYVNIMASTAVVADISPAPESRALRFAIIEGLVFVSGALSQLALGYLIREVGFFLPLLLCAVCIAITFIMVTFFLPRTTISKPGFKWGITQHLRNTFGFYFWDGTKLRRAQFCVGLSAFLTINLFMHGKTSVELLFFMNDPICWNSMDIGIFNFIRLASTTMCLSARRALIYYWAKVPLFWLVRIICLLPKHMLVSVFQTVAMSVVALVVLKVLKLRLSLEVTGMICLLSPGAGFILEGFARSTEVVYLSSFVGSLTLAVVPLPRALLSQIASADEQGALFSSLSCIETMAGMISSTVYTIIYNVTMDTFKGAVFMVMASVVVIGFMLLGTFRLLRRSLPRSYGFTVKDPEDDQKLGMNGAVGKPEVEVTESSALLSSGSKKYS